MSRNRLILLIGILLVAQNGWAETPANTSATIEPDLPEVVEFNRDIRPILSDICFNCHGPDAKRREANLRFDIEAEAKAKLESGSHAIVPGDVTASSLIVRITSANDDERMPPADFGRQLSARQVQLLTRWIEQGAKWQGHWAFIPPVRPELPAIKTPELAMNDIDRFILARLEAAGMTLSPEAARETLIRRVTLDLTGLPPTPEEVAAFVADQSPNAYETLVDRLLASPRYGERMATVWLDAARYADTSGYQTDGIRHQWRWREWVIDAFNTNKPFDAFTVEQIAGDLLPNATLDQQIATGFNRNHRTNSEGGIVDAEYLVEYVVDRVDTTSTVWLGLTLGCARCHDHKYDPITQRDFYRLFALFNNIPEQGRVIKYGNSQPVVKSPTAEMASKLAQLQQDLAAAEAKFAQLKAGLSKEQAKWEFISKPGPITWTITESLAAYVPLEGSLDQLIPLPEPKPSTTPLSDAAKAAAAIPLGFKEGEPVYESSGRVGQSIRLDGKSWVDAARVPTFGGEKRVSLGIWFNADGPQEAPLFTLMNDNDSRDNGLSVALVGDRVRVSFGPRWLDDALRVESVEPISLDGWQHVMITYDGSQSAAGMQLYINGKLVPTRALLDTFTGTFTTASLLRLGSVGEGITFKGSLDEFRFYERELTPEEVEIVATPSSVDTILAQSANLRTAGEQAKLAAYYLAEQSSDGIRKAWHELQAAQKAMEAFEREIPTTMVMHERDNMRETHMLIRGEYDKLGEAVEPGVPACFPQLPSDAPANRLALARWLVDPQHPLVARVAVNRYWQQYFGTGLVRTVEDFGAQGQWPTHPELLDYLATEFVRTGWNVKSMQKLIVMSSTYRQASLVTKENAEHDPENKLLGRAPRLRLPAEMIRDQALASSGLLIEKIGGPSVKIYQPDGLWKELTNDQYEQDHGEALYRRSMYTFWKRTVPPPTMTTFDASAREACTLNRSRTNTPLQALALLNDVTYVEAARKLAERVMTTELSTTPEARLTLAFQLVLARVPDGTELKILAGALERNVARYQSDAEGADKLVGLGESARNENLDKIQLAAMAATCSLILNLDEAVTRE